MYARNSEPTDRTVSSSSTLVKVGTWNVGGKLERAETNRHRQFPIPKFEFEQISKPVQPWHRLVSILSVLRLMIQRAIDSPQEIWNSIFEQFLRNFLKNFYAGFISIIWIYFEFYHVYKYVKFYYWKLIVLIIVICHYSRRNVWMEIEWFRGEMLLAFFRVNANRRFTKINVVCFYKWNYIFWCIIYVTWHFLYIYI